jgi:hypothetical protein
VADYHAMKTGNTSPPVVYDMTDLEGPVASVTFSMRKPGTATIKVDSAAATFLEVSSTSMRAFYDWAEEDVDEEGTFFRMTGTSSLSSPPASIRLSDQGAPAVVDWSAC